MPFNTRAGVSPTDSRPRIVVLVCALFVILGIENATAQPQRPLVVVPGILGSRLVDTNGRVVWGDRNSFLNFQELEITPTGPCVY
jgi:hypothetical protein